MDKQENDTMYFADDTVIASEDFVVKENNTDGITSQIESLQEVCDTALANAISALEKAESAADDAVQAQKNSTNSSADSSNSAEYAKQSAISSASSAQDAKSAREALETIQSSLSSVYKLKGSVNTVDALPQDAEIGDVYNVLTDGMNYAWTGVNWDALGGIQDLSAYAKSADVKTSLATKSDLLHEHNITDIQDGDGKVTVSANSSTSESSTCLSRWSHIITWVKNWVNNTALKYAVKYKSNTNTDSIGSNNGNVILAGDGQGGTQTGGFMVVSSDSFSASTSQYYTKYQRSQIKVKRDSSHELDTFSFEDGDNKIVRNKDISDVATKSELATATKAINTSLEKCVKYKEDAGIKTHVEIGGYKQASEVYVDSACEQDGDSGPCVHSYVAICTNNKEKKAFIQGGLDGNYYINEDYYCKIDFKEKTLEGFKTIDDLTTSIESVKSSQLTIDAICSDNDMKYFIQGIVKSTNMDSYADAYLVNAHQHYIEDLQARIAVLEAKLGITENTK